MSASRSVLCWAAFSAVLQGKQIADDGLAAVAVSPCFQPVIPLDLRYDFIGACGIRALADSPHPSSLAFLWPYENHFSAERVEARAASPTLSSSTQFGLSSNRIGSKPVSALLDSSYHNRLERLTTYSIDMTDKQGALPQRFGHVS